MSGGCAGGSSGFDVEGPAGDCGACASERGVASRRDGPGGVDALLVAPELDADGVASAGGGADVDVVDVVSAGCDGAEADDGGGSALEGNHV